MNTPQIKRLIKANFKLSDANAKLKFKQMQLQKEIDLNNEKIKKKIDVIRKLRKREASQ